MSLEYYKKFGAVRLKEIIQAGDCFLIKLDCPKCKNEFLCDYEKAICPECDLSIKDIPIVEPKRGDYRLLAGTRRRRIFGKKTIQNLLDIQNRECAYCAIDISNIDFHVDHIKPVSFGGSNSLNNLVISCPQCNLTAYSFVFKDFYAKKEFILNKRFGY
jgi:hypothetical protein